MNDSSTHQRNREISGTKMGLSQGIRLREIETDKPNTLWGGRDQWTLFPGIPAHPHS